MFWFGNEKMLRFDIPHVTVFRLLSFQMTGSLLLKTDQNFLIVSPFILKTLNRKDKILSFCFNHRVWLSPERYFSIFPLPVAFEFSSFSSSETLSLLCPSSPLALSQCWLSIKRQREQSSRPAIRRVSGSLGPFVVSDFGGEGQQRYQTLQFLSCWWVNSSVQEANCNTFAVGSVHCTEEQL